MILKPCDYGRETVNVIARVGSDLSPVFPYLNATVPGASYDRRESIMRFRWEGHIVSLTMNAIAMGGFENSDVAIENLSRFIQTINDLWSRRESVSPSYVERKKLNPLDLYRLLPQTNCKACHFPNCFVFATNLAAGSTTIDDCPVLQEAGYSSNFDKLRELISLSAF